MSVADPIASPTLALLYLTQGHLPRARAMLDELVAIEPHDGHALALLARLGPPPGRVTARIAGDDIVITWQGIALRPAVHVVAVTARTVRGRVRTGVTSVPCRAPFGRVELARPHGHGTLATCIGHVTPGRGFVAVAIAAPLSWV